jgi:hypothetical protein
MTAAATLFFALSGWAAGLAGWARLVRHWEGRPRDGRRRP